MMMVRRLLIGLLWLEAEPGVLMVLLTEQLLALLHGRSTTWYHLHERLFIARLLLWFSFVVKAVL